MIKEFRNGLRTDRDLEEDYLDWFFLTNFGKGPNFWRSLPQNKVENIIAFENLKQEEYWETWVDIYKKIYSK